MATEDCITPTRCCTKCKTEYPATVEYFARNAQSKSGLATACKLCRKARSAAYYLENKEQINARNKAYFEAHPEKYREYNRKWRSTEASKEHRHKYYLANKNRHRMQTAAWYLAHKAEVSEQSRKRRADPKYKLREREQKRRYRAAKPDIARAAWQRRYARKLNARGNHTAADIAALKRGQTDAKGILHCWWCGCALEAKFEIDHRIPLSQGGTHDPGNLCVSCANCNRSKGGRLPHEWRNRLL